MHVATNQGAASIRINMVSVDRLYLGLQPSTIYAPPPPPQTPQFLYMLTSMYASMCNTNGLGFYLAYVAAICQCIALNPGSLFLGKGRGRESEPEILNNLITYGYCLVYIHVLAL